MTNTMPARALGAVERLLEELQKRMRQEMPALLARADELMARAIVDAGDKGIAVELQEGRRNLERGFGRLLPEFMASLRRQVEEAWLHAPQAPPPDAFPDRLEPLRLLDEAIVDEDAAIAGIAPSRSRDNGKSSVPFTWTSSHSSCSRTSMRRQSLASRTARKSSNVICFMVETSVQ